MKNYRRRRPTLRFVCEAPSPRHRARNRCSFAMMGFSSFRPDSDFYAHHYCAQADVTAPRHDDAHGRGARASPTRPAGRRPLISRHDNSMLPRAHVGTISATARMPRARFDDDISLLASPTQCGLARLHYRGGDEHFFGQVGDAPARCRV